MRFLSWKEKDQPLAQTVSRDNKHHSGVRQSSMPAHELLSQTPVDMTDPSAEAAAGLTIKVFPSLVNVGDQPRIGNVILAYGSVETAHVLGNDAGVID